MSINFSSWKNLLKTNNVALLQPAIKLQRSLGTFETWGFGLTGHVGWIGTAPVIHAVLGTKAIFVWLPGVLISVALNLQVKHLGMCWPNMAGGTPNYAAKLLSKFPLLARYVAIGYFLGWVAAPAVYAIVLTDLIRASLEGSGIPCPEMLLKFGFTAIAFIVGLSGTRTLGILHLFFVIPAVVSLLTFCIQGIGWLALSPESPGFFPAELSVPSFGEWAKWFFISTYSVYSCETASSFVADSRKPAKTAEFLRFAAWLVPIIFLGGSWVLTRLANQPVGDNLYLNLLAAAKLFWGESASTIITLLISFSCLLSCATTVSNTSRILYQLSVDGHISPVFSVVSRRGVLGPALLFTFILSILCLAIGNLSHVVMVTGTGYLISIMGLHLGLWLRRDSPESLWPRWALGFLVLEIAVLLVGGFAWGWQELIIGLLFPLAILALDRVISYGKLPIFQPQWWIKHYYAKSKTHHQDFIFLQVIVLLVLICSSVSIGWIFSYNLVRAASQHSLDLLVVLLVTLSFIGVAIACWTTLPQITSIDDAREEAENLFINALDAILVVDNTGVIVKTNPAAVAVLKMSKEALVGQHLQKLCSHLVGLPHQWSSRSEQSFFSNTNESRILEVSISSNCQQMLQEYTVILRDVTERKQAESLRESEERYALAVRGANDGLWDWNLQTNEIYYSVRWKAMLGYQENEIQNNLYEWFNRVDAEDLEQVRVEFSAHLEGLTPYFENEHRLLHKDGTYRWMLSRGQVVRDATGKAHRVAGSQTDVTARRLAEQQLLHDALHDSLTGLSNRVLFSDRLAHVLSLAKRRQDYNFAVLFIDLDRFKVINDSLGHSVGDQLLSAIAQRLRVCLRTSDTFARLGGDEFAILLEDVQQEEDATYVAERIGHELRLPFNLNGNEVFAAASIGVLLGSNDYNRPEELLRDADTAMYRAKAQGKGCYEVFNIDMRDRAIALLHLENDLRRAVENQEFQLHYQPIVSLKNQKIIGFEALVRWQHPQKGLIAPMEFIPVAEDTGLIVPLGWWVLKEACRQMRVWQLQFAVEPPLTINVNLSGKQFTQLNLIDQIEQILIETGLDASSLKLEITESCIMENMQSAAFMLSKLQEIGVQVAIDDFGTGYSSLAYLHRFPVNTLKIDRSFINGLDGDGLEIVRAIVNLAWNLGMEVVAEGVETELQIDQLNALKSNAGQEYLGQGYLFSKPLNSNAATALMSVGLACGETSNAGGINLL